MAQKHFLTILAATLVLALTSASLSAQRITRRIFVDVTDATGAPVPDLAAADFEIIEDGAPRAVARAALGKAPMRIVLLVDSSSAVAPMLNAIRDALNAFIDALPPEHEVAFITTGGQIRIRMQPGTDRQKLKAEAARFASDSGANSFLDTLLECDRRFLKPAAGQWPVFVILTTDFGDERGDPRIDAYNKFIDDFLLRGGAAHGVVVKGSTTGLVTEFAQNLVQNTGGSFDVINLPNGLPPRFQALGERLAADHRRMANRYEVEYPSDAKLQQPRVQVGVAREGTRVRISLRRPF